MLSFKLLETFVLLTDIKLAVMCWITQYNAFKMNAPTLLAVAANVYLTLILFSEITTPGIAGTLLYAILLH